MATPYEELKAANEAYHVAIDRILSITSDTIPTVERAKMKAFIAAEARNIFGAMSIINDKLKPYFRG